MGRDEAKASADSTADPAGADPHAVEVGRLQGRIGVLEEHLAALDAAEEHHRVELEAARAEAADAQAALRESQARTEGWRRQVDDLRQRLDAAEAQRQRADEDRSAVIAALGRRARRQLDRAAAPSP